MNSRQICKTWLSWAAVTATVLMASPARSDEKKPIDDPQHAAKMARGLELFKKTVRPVLIGRCLKCHGGESTEAEFSLATREELLKGGLEGPVVQVGKARQGRLYQLITHAAEPTMPEDGAKLTDLHIKAIATWIDLGAPYDRPLAVKQTDPLAWTKAKVDESRRDFWSFRRLSQAAAPKLDGDSWSRTEIDRFILARLREKGLAPNGPAEKRKLIRRAHFDLIGLPPSPAEVEQFIKDSDPKAYEKLLDRLLQSRHYGERWGRHWLDVARFAESHGFEQDYDRPHAYHFRDFVIQALNRDMPYDQFVRWQLAGDELAPDDPLAMMATGFLGAGVFPTQITANEVERTRYDALDDMTATLGTAMLGLTIGCARCHDHKFDPIPQADYYRMISTFSTTVRSNVELNMDPAGYKAAKAKFDRAHAPLVTALKDFERSEIAPRFDRWLADTDRLAELRTSADWFVLDKVQAKSSGGASINQLADSSLRVTGKNPNQDTYTLTATTSAGKIGTIRLEALPDAALVKKGPGRAKNGNFALSKIVVMAAVGNEKDVKPKAVKLVNPRATFQQNAKNLSIAASLDDDPKTGWAVDPKFGERQVALFDLAEPIESDATVQLTIRLQFAVNNQHGIGRLRLSIGPPREESNFDGSELAESVRGALSDNAKLSAEQRSALLSFFKRRDPEWKKLNAKVEQHLQQAPQPKLQTVMVASEGVKPIRHHTQGADFFEQTYFLKRGDNEQKQGVAEQGFLQVLTTAPEQEKHWQTSPPKGWRTSYRRRALADWITDTEYGPGHLLARVIVNRLWQHHFGRGIVATPNDFGAQGRRPTHPELLDWLARKLIEGGWRLKPMHKLMMTSAVYMQSTEFNEKRAAADPQNELHWRRNPQRLEAEIIRDAMLAASGALDRRMFGPGTLDQGHKRRSIYFMVKRSKLIPMMQLFDSPEPLVSVGNRPSTTIAPQALMFMNNPHVRGYAGIFAKRLMSEQKDGGGKPNLKALVSRGYQLALGRPPTAQELADNAAFLSSQSASYAAGGKSNSQTLALADLCQVLISLNEFVYVE